jgi:AraC family transcriptional activator of pobA
MPITNWDDNIKPVQKLIMQPVAFNDLSVTLLDALSALHGTDWLVKEHRHPWFEFNYISEGSAYTTLNGSEFLTVAGQVYIIPPGLFHSHRHYNHEGDNGFCLRWQLEKTEAPGMHLKLSECAQDIIRTLSACRTYGIQMNACELVEKVSRAKNLTVKQSVFVQWLISLYEFWGGKSSEKPYQNDHEKILVQQAMLYLSEYYANDLSVQDVADSLNVSYRHLARIFKHVTGNTIIEKLNDIRINEAKKLLKDTDKPIYEIAREVGFDNEYYFTTVFSCHSHITPSKFKSKFKD